MAVETMEANGSTGTLKRRTFARTLSLACRSGDEIEVSFPRFGVRGYSESGLVPVRRPCLAEFSNYAQLCTFEYAWSNAEEVRRIGLTAGVQQI